MDLDLDLDLDLELARLLVPRSTSGISYLKYTGFKGPSIASNVLSLRRPRIGYARLVIARNVSNQSTIPDSKRPLGLGHTRNVPLIWPRSDLSDGSEPHDHI